MNLKTHRTSRDRQVNRTAATAKAFQLLRELGFPRSTEVSLEDLSMYRGVLVVEEEIKGAEGRLVRNRQGGIIKVRPCTGSAGRHRFSIAHELGHWELHADYSQFLCSSEDMRDYGKSPVEVEANTFAAELLMPTAHFRPACRENEPSIPFLEKLASEFQASLTATAIRFADLTKYSVIIVWHENGIVKWSYARENQTIRFVAPGMEVPDYSSASLPHHEIVSLMESYDQADWFPQLTFPVGEVLEMTKRGRRISGGLTLLWLTER